MKKQNHTLRGGVVRSALALTLAVGLMPAQALTTIAVADEGAPQSTPAEQPEQIVTNVSDLLDTLIDQSVALVGKPAAVMNKDDKVKAIQFLSQNGAFLITKSGDKVAKYFGISKYTLYSYIDMNKED